MLKRLQLVSLWAELSAHLLGKHCSLSFHSVLYSNDTSSKLKLHHLLPDRNPSAGIVRLLWLI